MAKSVRKKPSLTTLRKRLDEIWELREKAIRKEDLQAYERLRRRFESTQQQIRKLEEDRKPVTREFIELANYNFSEGSWAEFRFILQNDYNVITTEQPDLGSTELEPGDPLNVQGVVGRALKGIVEKGAPPTLTLLEMAKHAEHVKHHITDVLSGSLRRYTMADEYHDKIYWEILSIDPTRIKLCDPECGCGLYFWDNTKNRAKTWYPGHGPRMRKRRERALRRENKLKGMSRS